MLRTRFLKIQSSTLAISVPPMFADIGSICFSYGYSKLVRIPHERCMILLAACCTVPRSYTTLLLQSDEWLLPKETMLKSVFEVGRFLMRW